MVKYFHWRTSVCMWSVGYVYRILTKIGIYLQTVVKNFQIGNRTKSRSVGLALIHEHSWKDTMSIVVPFSNSFATVPLCPECKLLTFKGSANSEDLQMSKRSCCTLVSITALEILPIHVTRFVKINGTRMPDIVWGKDAKNFTKL